MSSVRQAKKNVRAIIAEAAASHRLQRARIEDCARGVHRYGRLSTVFPGQKVCQCGAVEGENPN